MSTFLAQDQPQDIDIKRTRQSCHKVSLALGQIKPDGGSRIGHVVQSTLSLFTLPRPLERKSIADLDYHPSWPWPPLTNQTKYESVLTVLKALPVSGQKNHAAPGSPSLVVEAQ